jgi:hypothetical protein
MWAQLLPAQNLWSHLERMSDAEILSALATVTLLGAFLLIKRLRRTAAQSAPSRAGGLSGKPLDVSRLEPALVRVRHDYLGWRRPVHNGRFHAELMELTRAEVARLSYWNNCGANSCR